MGDLASRDEELSWPRCRACSAPCNTSCSHSRSVRGGARHCLWVSVLMPAAAPTVFWQEEGAGTLDEASEVGAEGGDATLPDSLILRDGETVIVAEALYPLHALVAADSAGDGPAPHFLLPTAAGRAALAHLSSADCAGRCSGPPSTLRHRIAGRRGAAHVSGHQASGRTSMSGTWQYQLRIDVPEQVGEKLRSTPGDAELTDLTAILARHDAKAVCQYDAFAGYCAEAEREGVGRVSALSSGPRPRSRTRRRRPSTSDRSRSMSMASRSTRSSRPMRWRRICSRWSAAASSTGCTGTTRTRPTTRSRRRVRRSSIAPAGQSPAKLAGCASASHRGATIGAGP